jgi:hypothetical protein
MANRSIEVLLVASRPEVSVRHVVLLVCLLVVVVACTDETASQLAKLEVLLHSEPFALEMATHLDGAYYRGIGQTPPPFLTPQDETATVVKNALEEKVATNLAGFYALEAGLGVISERTKEPPLDIVEGIARAARTQEEMLVLARFANATWKAGQPFRALNRIGRPVFRPAALLPEDEIRKDLVQVKAAAARLVAAMAPVRGRDRAEQLRFLQGLLQSREMALEMAAYLDAAYYGGQRQTPPPFAVPGDEAATVRKSVKEERIAINLAGFYAVEVGGNVIGERTHEPPMRILETVVDGSRPAADMLLLARFANATWKAGQPFRALNRISRDTFRPAALLSDDELKKDFDQIKAAAAKLLEAMRRP